MISISPEAAASPVTPLAPVTLPKSTVMVFVPASTVTLDKVDVAPLIPATSAVVGSSGEPKPKKTEFAGK